MQCGVIPLVHHLCVNVYATRIIASYCERIVEKNEQEIKPVVKSEIINCAICLR